VKIVLTLAGVLAIGSLLWFLRGSSDATTLAAKNAEIAALQDASQTKDKLLTQSNGLLDARAQAIKELQGKIQSSQDLLAKDQTQLASDKAAYQRLQDANQKIVDSLKGDNQADIDALKEQIQAKDDAIAQLNEKLVQTIADYEAKLNAMRNRTEISDTDSGKKIYPKDDGFEQQDLGPGCFNYFGEANFNPTHVELPAPVPNQTGWKFGGNAGLAANGTFYVNNATNGNHDGKTSSGGQVAFLQAKGSWLSQMIRLPAGTYSVSFDFESRRDYEPANGIAVSLNGTDLFVGAPTDMNNFVHVTTESIHLAAAREYELKFRGLGALSDPDGDHTTFIDNVCINVIDPHKHSAKKTTNEDANFKSIPGKPVAPRAPINQDDNLQKELSEIRQ
jgi:hypothetical protein